ncbi:MAG: peptidase [Vicinamibacteria bacterium]|nr:peptidase [Vicinamibacteria bacterium]
MRKFLVVAFVVLATGAGAQDCSIIGQNQTVYQTLKDWYYWYRNLPTVSPSTFASPEALLDTVRYRPIDNTFSYVSSASSSQAFYGDSQYLGFGFSMKFTVGYELRVTDVFPASPAAELGFDRGSEILALNGKSIQQTYEDGEWNTIWGGEEEGYALEVSFKNAAGEARSGRIAKRVVTIPTVPLTQIQEVGGKKVAYIVFKNFVEPSYAALDAAFAQAKAGSATELVLDLRYNGGGLIAVAQYLGGLIGGDRTSGEIFAQYVHNDKRGSNNNAIRFPRPADAFPLSRLIVITTKSSASASELIINALKPFIPVVVVGDNSYGKPVGQYGFRICEKMLWPVSFSVQNALGQGDYYDGFVPDCRAADDINRPLGDPKEASLAAALTYVETGACPAGAAVSAASSDRGRPGPAIRAHAENGWQALRVAY